MGLFFIRADFREQGHATLGPGSPGPHAGLETRSLAHTPRQIGTMGLDAARAKQIAANKRLMHGAASWRGPIHKNKINFTLGWGDEWRDELLNS